MKKTDRVTPQLLKDFGGGTDSLCRRRRKHIRRSSMLGVNWYRRVFFDNLRAGCGKGKTVRAEEY